MHARGHGASAVTPRIFQRASESQLCMQVFFAFTVSAHNSMPWLTKGRPHPGRPDPLILDAPLWHHWPEMLIWLPFQGSIIYLLSAWAASGFPS